VAWAGFGAVYTAEVPGTALRLVPAAKGVQDELLRRLWWRRLWDIMCQKALVTYPIRPPLAGADSMSSDILMPVAVRLLSWLAVGLLYA
jgi:hypothetical protein